MVNIPVLDSLMYQVVMIIEIEVFFLIIIIVQFYQLSLFQIILQYQFSIEFFVMILKDLHFLVLYKLILLYWVVQHF